MIGCPVRNRAWVLPRYLKNLHQVEYPLKKREYCFIINDCIDATPDMLKQFACQQSCPVRLINYNFGSRTGHRRGEYRFTRLAQLRNLLLREFLQSGCQYLFSVDSDILVPPQALARLVGEQRDIVSALVCNGHELGDEKIYNVLIRNEAGRFIHLKDFPRDRVFQVDCTGAACLISRRVIEQYGIRYSAHLGAEDIGFCQAAAQRGLKIYCDGRLECMHLMKEEL